MTRATSRRGFTLVEINLAIMLLAVGLLVVFSLFPAGLDQGNLAYRDSQAGLFADYVLNGMRGNAGGIESWQAWRTQFGALAMAGLGVPAANAPREIEFPVGSGNYIRYLLELTPLSGGRLWAATLWVWGQRYGPGDVEVFKQRSRRFRTTFYFMGGQP